MSGTNVVVTSLYWGPRCYCCALSYGGKKKQETTPAPAHRRCIMRGFLEDWRKKAVSLVAVDVENSQK